MSNVLPFPDRAKARQEAADWLMRIDRGSLSEAERKALSDWLAGHPSRRLLLVELARIWGSMDSLSVLAELFPDPATSRVEVDAARSTRKKAFGASVSALLLIVALLAIQPVTQFWKTVSAETYVARTGQQSRVILPDGSRMILNTRSEARVIYGARERLVELLKGEAYFEVRPDPRRPFAVEAAAGSVRAVGTAFSVHRQESGVQVLVSEGVVEVALERNRHSRRGTATLADQYRRVEAGSTVRYREAVSDPQSVSAAELGRRLAWTEGRWEFEGETLLVIVGELQRYTDRRIEIRDPEIATLRIGGYFDVGDVEGFLRALEEGFAVSSQTDEDGLIVLTRHSGDQADEE
ncbi:MAG: FecR family protein [Steroidobacteraceae bacterium]